MRPTAIFRIFVLAITLASTSSLAGDKRDENAFRAWSERIKPERLSEYEKFLSKREVLRIAPLHELLRTSSDWETSACARNGAQPFEIPPSDLWDSQARTLNLIKLLSKRKILPPFEIASAYRNNLVESCSKGAGKRHPTAGAFDLVPRNPGDRAVAVEALCKFWREEGLKHDMGFSVYPSGRIHIDTVKFSTWGENGKSNTSRCLQKQGLFYLSKS